MSTIKTTRINTGVYEFSHAGATYQVERYPDGAWLLFEMSTKEYGPDREYLNDFATKSAAIAAVLSA